MRRWVPVVPQQLEGLHLGRLVGGVVEAAALEGRQVAAGGDGNHRMHKNQSVITVCTALPLQLAKGEIETDRRLTYMLLLTAACH